MVVPDRSVPHLPHTSPFGRTSLRPEPARDARTRRGVDLLRTARQRFGTRPLTTPGAAAGSPRAAAEDPKWPGSSSKAVLVGLKGHELNPPFADPRTQPARTGHPDGRVRLCRLSDAPERVSVLMGVVWPALTPQGKDRPGNVRGALSYARVMVRRVVPAVCSIAAVACDDACDPLAVAAAATPAAATTPPPTKSFRAAFMARSFQERESVEKRPPWPPHPRMA